MSTRGTPTDGLSTALGPFPRPAVLQALADGVVKPGNARGNLQYPRVKTAPIERADLSDLECVRTGRFTMGPQTSAFESEFAAHVGAKYAVMTNSGSSANLLSVSVLKALRPNVQTVAVSAVTWPTNLAPIIQLGLKPVVIDVDLDTLVPSYVPQAVDCSFAVHLLGQPAELQLHDRQILLEDTCEALGARYSNGTACGTRGLMGTFSFYFSHHLTTIEGGMVVTNCSRTYEQLLMQRAHGWVRDLPDAARKSWARQYPDIEGDFLFPALGYNFRPTEIQAELGRRNMLRLTEMQQRQEEMARILHNHRPACMQTYRTMGQHAWFAYPLVLRDPDPALKSKIASGLRSAGVHVRPIVAGNILLQPFAQQHSIEVVGDLPNANHVHNAGLYLGISPTMSDDEFWRMVDVVDTIDHCIH